MPTADTALALVGSTRATAGSALAERLLLPNLLAVGRTLGGGGRRALEASSEATGEALEGGGGRALEDDAAASDGGGLIGGGRGLEIDAASNEAAAFLGAESGARACGCVVGGEDGLAAGRSADAAGPSAAGR